MTKPWEKYQTAGQTKAGPWARYGAKQAPQQSPEMASALSDLSAMSQKPQVQHEDPGALRSAFIGGAQGATFGFADEIAARLLSMHPQIDYDKALPYLRGEIADARATHPVVTTGAEIAGAVASPFSKIGAGWASTGGLASRSAKSAITAAMQGAGYGFGAGEGGLKDRLENAGSSAAIGAVLGGAIPVVGSAIGAGLNRLASGRQVAATARGAPTTEELRAAGRAAYKAVDDAGVRVSPQAFSSAVSDITDALQQNGLKLGVGRDLAPKSAAISEVMADVATDPKFAEGVPFSEIDTIRKLAGAPASTIGNDLEQSLGVQVRNGLDDFINGLTPDQVTSGNSVDFPALVAKARDTWATMRRSQTVDDAIAAGQEYVSGSASGIRNQFSRILKSPRLSAGFSDVEKAAMRRVATGGSVPEKLLHLAAGGMGQMATIGGGAGLGGLPGAAIGAALASGTRKASEALANRQAEVVRAMIANGGIAQAPQIGTEARKIIENLLRAGMAAGVQRR